MATIPQPTTISVNPNYAAHQIAKAFTTSTTHADPTTRARAEHKIQTWHNILANIFSNQTQYGSRTPFKNVPAWVTLEVAAGGFATGRFMAAGELLEHEIALLKQLNITDTDEPRLVLNRYFLTEQGLAQLQEYLTTGCYEVTVPEEGALLVVAWLMLKGYSAEARILLAELAPFFARLRFYPKPLAAPKVVGSTVYLQTVGEVIGHLQQVRASERVLAQHEALKVWLPYYDRLVALIVETIGDDYPYQYFPLDWQQRAKNLLKEYEVLKKQYTRCSKHLAGSGHYQAQLREILNLYINYPRKITGYHITRTRTIINSYMAKRGKPLSEQHQQNRQEQLLSIRHPTNDILAKIVIERLANQLKDRGLETIEPFVLPITEAESLSTQVPVGFVIPNSIISKVNYARMDTAENLIDQGLITSAETLARVLPQITSGLQAAGISDTTLRPLYAALYQAFRKRRSLLLFNLESQVKFSELLWVSTLAPFRSNSLSTQELAKQTLEEVTTLTLKAFPYTIIPNKLLQELRALVGTAKLQIPLVDELAADIFMGQFTEKFSHAVKIASSLLEGSLYARYYGIDYEYITAELDKPIVKVNTFKKKGKKYKEAITVTTTDFDTYKLANICSERAGVPLNSWSVANNGMILEQEQILTTQNLAVLWVGLELDNVLKPHLTPLAQNCFIWIMKELKIQRPNWHSKLITIKNVAYAWRQMVFFMSVMPFKEQGNFIEWMKDYFTQQPVNLQSKFQPAITGLESVVQGDEVLKGKGLVLLGWTSTKHWLLSRD